MSTTMLALFQHAYGDLSSFKTGQLPRPSPNSNQVLIRVHAAALNPVDIARANFSIHEEKFPVVTGYDVAGVVEAVGELVTSFKKGDRVFGDIQAISSGPKASGSVAEFCVSDHHLLAPIPDGISFESAAALPVAACTAIQAFDVLALKEGDKVFISGGAGGVGIHAIQIARALYGAAEVATTASSAKIDFVRMYGADRVVDYRKEDAGKILEGWADVVLDCTTETEMAKRIVKAGGSMLSVAAFGVPAVRSLELVPGKELMEKTAALAGSGKLTPVIDIVYPIEEAMKAIEHLESKRAKGKIIVKVGHS
eukprot:GFKZ01014041.1.p1 GENE.GFKZ01014041.1~~GFKZ01014041.1.p1  ORF type:complete len:310 (+),score=52.20 GFKZ01014041.1:588-1517(+)